MSVVCFSSQNIKLVVEHGKDLFRENDALAHRYDDVRHDDY